MADFMTGMGYPPDYGARTPVTVFLSRFRRAVQRAMAERLHDMRTAWMAKGNFNFQDSDAKDAIAELERELAESGRAEDDN